MSIQGLRTTGNFITDQRPKNWREGILLLQPNGSAPLFALTSLMKSKRTDDPEFYWFDKLMQTRRVALGANLTLNNTSITLTGNAKRLKTNDVLLVEQTREIIRVTADPSSNTKISVERGFANSTAATVDYDGSGVNPNMAVIGSANEQGSLPPTNISFDPTRRDNNCQIHRDTFGITRTARKTRLRTGDAVKEAKRECLEIHSMGIERSMWFGKKSQDTLNGEPIYTTDGVENMIDSGNIVTAPAGGTDLMQFEEYMMNMFLYGSSEKMAFTGNRGMLTIQQIVRKNSEYQFMQGQKEFGMTVNRLISPFGELILKTHPQFNQMVGGTTGTAAYYGVDSWFFVLDMANFVYRFVDDTMFESKLEANGLDGMQSGYLTECGLELHHPLTHFLIKDLHTAKADT